MSAAKIVLRRATTLATVAALALTAVAPSVATAAPRAKGVTASAPTDISARRRVVRGAGGAAAAAAFAGIVGTGLAIAAAQNRRAYYDDYYGGGPVYVAPGPGYGYYGGGYGPGYGYYQQGW